MVIAFNKKGIENLNTISPQIMAVIIIICYSCCCYCYYVDHRAYYMDEGPETHDWPLQDVDSVWN